MDAWGHMLFAFAIAIGIGLYPAQPMKKLLFFMIAVMFVNFLIAAFLENPIYNGIGVMLRAPVIGYLLYKRSQSSSAEDQARLEQLAIVLFGATYLSAASHAFDQVLDDSGFFIEWRDMWRGHNVWHAPMTAIIFSFLTALIVFYGFRYIGESKNEIFITRSTVLGLFLACTFGYFTHIIADTITYDFQIFWFFPFIDYSFSGEDIVNHGIFTEQPRPNKPEGTVYYWSIPFFAFLAGFTTAFKYIMHYKGIQEAFLNLDKTETIT